MGLLMPELRLDVTEEDMAVLDGYCSARGKHRSDVIRDLLKQWSSEKLHEATVILRVAGRIPLPAEGERR